MHITNKGLVTRIFKKKEREEGGRGGGGERERKEILLQISKKNTNSQIGKVANSKKNIFHRR